MPIYAYCQIVACQVYLFLLVVTGLNDEFELVHQYRVVAITQAGGVDNQVAVHLIEIAPAEVYCHCAANLHFLQFGRQLQHARAQTYQTQVAVDIGLFVRKIHQTGEIHLDVLVVDTECAVVALRAELPFGTQFPVGIAFVGQVADMGINVT